MKKTLAILIALALVVSAASAQVVVKGSLKLGAMYSTSADLKDGGVRMYQDNVAGIEFNSYESAKGVQQMNVQFTYTNGPASMKINMRSEDFGTFGTNVAFVSLDMFDKKAKLLYGLTEDNTFRVGTWEQPDIDGKNNLALIVTPVAGLTLGFDAEMPTAGAVAMNTKPNGTTGYTLEQWIYQFAGGVKYVNAMVEVKAGFRGDKAAGNVYAPKTELAYLGLAYLGYKPLTLSMYGAWYNITGEFTNYYAGELSVAYMISDVLKVGTVASFDGVSKTEDLASKKAEITFVPYVNYSLNPSTMLILEGYYSMNEDNVDGTSDMYVEPRVTYTVNDNAKITGFCQYYMMDLSNKVTTVKATSAVLVGVDFLYAF